MKHAREPNRGSSWTSPQAIITPSSGGSTADLQGTRQAKVIVTRMDPLSVLRFSLLFYFCVMLIVLFALAILYWILGLIGVLNSASHFLSNLGLGSAKTGFQFNGNWVFLRVAAVGLGSVVVWSLVTTCLTLLYNLVADVVGGVRITISERR